MRDEGGYVILRYENKEQKELLKNLIMDGEIELVKKTDYMDEENGSEGSVSNLWEDFKSNYANKNKEGTYSIGGW